MKFCEMLSVASVFRKKNPSKVCIFTCFCKEYLQKQIKKILKNLKVSVESEYVLLCLVLFVIDKIKLFLLSDFYAFGSIIILFCVIPFIFFLLAVFRNIEVVLTKGAIGYLLFVIVSILLLLRIFDLST